MGRISAQKDSMAVLKGSSAAVVDSVMCKPPYIIYLEAWCSLLDGG
jgi:hypothetical protein